GWLPALTLGQANKTPPWPADRLASLNKALGKLETSSQGRLGVALLDSASGQLASYRGDERFLMLSSFKTLAAAYILARSDRGEDELTRRIPITEADLLEYAPVTRQHVGPQGMT